MFKIRLFNMSEIQRVQESFQLVQNQVGEVFTGKC